MTLSSGDLRCSRTFFFPERRVKWLAHVIDPSGPYTLENCEILCMQCAEARRRDFGQASGQGD